MIVGIASLELRIACVVFLFLLFLCAISADYVDIRIVFSLIESVHHSDELVKSLRIELCDHIAYMEAYAVYNVIEDSKLDIVLREFIFMVCVYENEVSSVYVRSVMNFCCIL